MKVRCIKNTGVEGHLKIGEIYEIDKIVGRGDYLRYHIVGTPPSQTWLPWRFEKFEEKPQDPYCKCGIMRVDCEYHR